MKRLIVLFAGLIVAGTACADLNLIPMPPGTVRGKVTFNGQPAIGAVVQATVAGGDRMENWVSGRPANQTQTQIDGSYAIYYLHPGEFTVVVNHNGQTVEKKATVRSGIDSFVDFALTGEAASPSPSPSHSPSPSPAASAKALVLR